jgi:amidase
VLIAVLAACWASRGMYPSGSGALQLVAEDRDLLEATIPKLERLYATHKYTVTEVVSWYLGRINRYNGIYRAVAEVDSKGALAAAAAEDAAARRGGAGFKRGPMWGVPMVIKANTSVKGLVTSDGWKGFVIPGHELVAPKDASVVARLRAAGVVFLGHTNMPDFAASDTNRSSAFGRTGNAYDLRFSPGGSSGGTVTAVTANFAEMGTGTDTSNSIRMPSSTSSVVGMLPTRGLVSIAGIAPLDWLVDNTGPIGRTVTDVAIALGVMAGEDPLDFRTVGSAAKAQPGPYPKYLKADSLKGKRFGVPAFMLKLASGGASVVGFGLRPETGVSFLKAVQELRKAGATVVFDDSLLADGLESQINGEPYLLDGIDSFLREFGPAGYHSAVEYKKAVGAPIPGFLTGGLSGQVSLLSDPNRNANFFGPVRKLLDTYNEALDRLHLDGLVYPAANMPPVDETMPQDGRLSSGPHSNTGWVNPVGVPAIVVPGAFYDDGLPFGLEISGRQWKDGDLLGYAYAFEQATRHRHPPVLVEKGLLPNAR